MDRLKIAQYIAIVASIISVIGWGMNFMGANGGVASTFIGLGLIVAIVAYVFGGLLTALKTVWDIGKYGFLVGGVPFCLVCGVATTVIAFMVMFILPIIPIRKAYLQSH